MTSEKRAQKFHTDDGSLPRSGSASDWLNQISHAARPVRSTAQIWLVTRHQYVISALVSQTSFGGETSGSVVCFVRLCQFHVTQIAHTCAYFEGSNLKKWTRAQATIQTMWRIEWRPLNRMLGIVILSLNRRAINWLEPEPIIVDSSKVFFNFWHILPRKHKTFRDSCTGFSEYLGDICRHH